MPYKSDKQRKFMHAVVPEVARKWDKKYGGQVGKKATAKKNRKRNG